MVESEPHIDAFGNRVWLLHNKIHREDGPALEYSDGTKEWYVNGYRHREDGPAVEWDDGTLWYLNGVRLHFDDWCDTLGISHEEKTLLILKYF